MKNQPAYDYQEAFSRTLGWMTLTEQNLLKTKKIAIAGMGGVGGQHLLTLARLGLEKFNIADFDTFELANFNRQAGASMPHLGKPKASVMEQLTLDINPYAQLQTFQDGLHHRNMNEFFEGVDLFIDGLDFFALDIRSQAMAYCHSHNIPALTAAPLGFGTSILIFMPHGMSFEQYFRLNNQAPLEQAIRFLIGLAPAGLHRHALIDSQYLNLSEKRGPSTPVGCQLSASLVATQCLKILLQRGSIVAAPQSFQFDAYTYKVKLTSRPFRAYSPMQGLQRYLARKHLSKVTGKYEL